MRTRLWLRSFSFAGLLLALTVSRALGMPVTSGPVPPSDAATIASLTNQYLQDAIGATNTGAWLDATTAGNAANRGQSLLIPSSAGVAPGAGTTTLDSFNTTTQALISANDGAGDSISAEHVFVSQFSVTYNASGAGSSTFDTFCIDLFHIVSVGQTYAVDVRFDLATAFANGAQMAYILANFGVGDLSTNPDQAAAVQIALWDLSLNNHNPTSFGLDADGSYSSGDPSVFSVNFASPVPEPPSLFLFAAGLGGLALIRRRRAPRCGFLTRPAPDPLKQGTGVKALRTIQNEWDQ